MTFLTLFVTQNRPRSESQSLGHLLNVLCFDLWVCAEGRVINEHHFNENDPDSSSQAHFIEEKLELK